MVASQGLWRSFDADPSRFGDQGGTTIWELITVTGTDTLLDLSGLTEIDAGFDSEGNDSDHQQITVLDGGTLDLSSVVTVTAPDDGIDRIEFIVRGTMSEIDLSSLQTIDGNSQARFDVQDGTVLLGDVTNMTTLEAEGNISTTNLTNDSLLNPGIGTGRLDLTGDFTQTINGSLNIQLGGTMTGEYDELLISNTAELDGILNISLVNGYAPELGDSFDIISFGSRQGDFDDIILPTLSGDLAFSAQFIGNTLNLEVVNT